MGVFSGLFDSATLAPHGFCLSWEPGIMALHIVSDGLIATSYYSIPLAIAFLLLRRQDVAFGWMAWLFAVFITACGTTHVMGIWTLWRPDYLADGLVKVVTAVASVLTATALWPLLPRLVALPSPGVLLQANERLTQQIAERDAAVAALRHETAERLRTEEMLHQSQKMEAVGQLTGGMAHDFNNLLQVIQANLEVMEVRLASDDPHRKHVERAMHAAEKGAALTQQLLAFARRQSLHPAQFAVNERIAALTDLLRGTLGGDIRLETRCDDSVWLAEADPHQLETALLNLVINARDAMPGGGRLTIEADNATLDAAAVGRLPDVEPGDYVRIAVTDNGSGMTPDVRDAAFEPFFTTKAVGQGSGLGLSQVYGFIKQSRGHITLESAPGQGTTVALYLRRAMPVPVGMRGVDHEARLTAVSVSYLSSASAEGANIRSLMMDRHTLTNGTLTATVKAEGAELCSLHDMAGTEMLWQAAAVWPRHAPVLFPIVGRLKDDRLQHQGKSYRLTQHGFARDHRFAWLNRSPTACRLVLHDDAETRSVYPFAFRLEIAFLLDDDTLETSYTVANPGRDVLPASLGAHPAFVWPLTDETEKSAHVLEFSDPEPAPVRRLDGGLLAPGPVPTPIAGQTLALDPALFDADAVILDQPASDAVRYTAAGAPTIEVAWQGFRQLGIWSRAGGDFVCIEPWHGMASPADFDGEFVDKPGLMLIPPGERRTLTMRIRLC